MKASRTSADTAESNTTLGRSATTPTRLEPRQAHTISVGSSPTACVTPSRAVRSSRERILTTHSGSLPRPTDLTELYARRAQGETVDEPRMRRLGQDATQRVVAKQLEAGIDIGNNGEQQREGFFLYVRHRMSGFGDSWERRALQDVTRYPDFQRQRQALAAAKAAVSNFHPPKAIAEVRYLDARAVHDECTTFHECLRLYFRAPSLSLGSSIASPNCSRASFSFAAPTRLHCVVANFRGPCGSFISLL